MAPRKLDPAEIPPGQILTYYGDLASGAIRPEDTRIEDLTFQLIVAADGTVAFQSPKITVVSRYNFAIRRVYAQIVNPLAAGAAAGLIRFNIFEQGRSFTIFKQPQSLAAAINNPIVHDGVYICVPGTDLEALWTIDTTLWVALVGASRVVEITVSGDYIACGPTER
jgi:hypothetical protein